MSPILFLTYINDLLKLNIPECYVLSFGEDTAWIFSGNTGYDAYGRANEGLLTDKSWFDSHILMMNSSKSNMAFLPTKAGVLLNHLQLKILTHLLNGNGNPNVNCSCQSILKVSTAKHLSIILDEHIKWDGHLHYLISILKYLIYIFCKINKQI